MPVYVSIDKRAPLKEYNIREIILLNFVPLVRYRASNDIYKD